MSGAGGVNDPNTVRLWSAKLLRQAISQTMTNAIFDGLIDQSSFKKRLKNLGPWLAARWRRRLRKPPTRRGEMRVERDYLQARPAVVKRRGKKLGRPPNSAFWTVARQRAIDARST